MGLPPPRLRPPNNTWMYDAGHGRDSQKNAMPLNVHIEHIGDHLLVRVAGDVDLETVGLLTNALTKAASTPDTSGVIVDLTAVTFFGASGLSALVNVVEREHQTGPPLVVIAQRHSIVRRVIMLASLTNVLSVTSLRIWNAQSGCCLL